MSEEIIETAMSIAEECATGMAAGPLACLLHDVLGDRRSNFMTPPRIKIALI